MTDRFFKIEYTNIYNYSNKSKSVVIKSTSLEDARLYYDSNMSNENLLDDIYEVTNVD